MTSQRTDVPLTTPVLFLVFRRPAETARVFEEIRRARPTRLFVAADGPRPDRSDDVAACQAVREIVSGVDWPCTVATLFRESNVGLKTAVRSAVDWLFDHAEDGIVLEDDCLPSQSFFWFCQALLDRYRDDQRVMQISGNNFLLGERVTADSYYFSCLNDVWGWATWKRAWRHYDADMATYPRFRAERQLENYITDPATRDWLMSYLDETFHATGPGGLWSSQWAYALCCQNALTAVPCVNLVANISGASDATNQTESFELYSTVDRHEMIDLVHPPFVLPNRRADAIRFDVIRRTDPRVIPSNPSLARRMLKRVARARVVVGHLRRRLAAAVRT
jgi:hypothetical protein